MANINDWLSIDKASGTGNAYITLTASSSTELQERIASLSVKTRSKEVFLNVKQLAFNNYFVLGKDLISPLWEGGNYSNYTLSNISWTYTSSDWLSLSITSGSVGKTEFNVVVQPNTSEETRIGFVNIVASNGVIMGTIKVAQASHNEVNNIIFYTSTDGNKITPYSSTGVVANEYVDGVGALYFADTITEVPKDLFWYGSTLASVSVPETVTTIKSGAFYTCRNLVSYDFPDALTTIEADAFRYCDSLAIFDFPYVETIGDYAFSECLSFETVILSDTLNTIGTGVFKSCTKLKSINIGSGLTSISDSLCNGCTSLKTVNISTTIKRIEQNAFNGCTAIETLNLHGGIDYIGKSAFGGNKIKSVTLGERTSALEQGGEPFKASTPFMADAYVTDIKSWLLWQPSIFTNDNIVRNLYVNGELLTEVVTPSDYDTVPEYAFYQNPHITRVIITDNVTDIGTNAFIGLNNANYLYLGSRASYKNDYRSNKKIYNTFTDFDGTLEIKNANASVLTNNYFTKVVFMGKTTGVPPSDSTQEIEFRGDVVSVSAGYYNAFKNVTRVVVNCNQLNIGGHLFYGAVLLTDFDFSKVSSIGNYAFFNTNITEITNAPLLTSIGDYAFSSLKLKTVDLPNSPLTSIGKYAFTKCTELKEMTLPSLSYDIGSYAFSDCSNLKHIKMAADIETKEMGIAKLSNSVYNTGINATVNSRLEFYYKYTQSPSGDAYYEVIGAGNTDDDNVFQIRIQNNVFHFHIGTSQFGVSGITPNVFHHFVVSLDEGIIVDGVLKKRLTRSDKTINAPFYINGIQYAPARHANGEFGTIKIDDNVITPKEDGFYNGSTKLDVVKSGEYEYTKEIVILNPPSVPKIESSTFNGVASYGFLEHPSVTDYSSWLSTSSYYLGYYNWNRFNLSAKELDFDAADTYEVTVNNGIPTNWEITKLPFWLSASVMSGGEGTTTITFTKIADYVETDDIIISIMGVNYVIKAKYTVRTLDFTKQDTYVLNISNTTSITDVEWLTETFDTEAVTLALSTIYTVESATIIITSSIGNFKVKAIADGTNTPLPNDNNRIYYTGSIDITNSVKYGTNADYVGTGYYGRGLYYIEYDRPILWITQQFGEGSNIKTLGLPSSLQYIDNNCFKDCSSLKSISFGGTEKYIGDNVFYNCSLLSNYTLPSTIYYYGNNCFYNTSNKNLIFGAETEYIGGGAFSNTSINKTIKFLGTIPPSVQSSTLENSTIYAPIGSDYSSLGVTIEYTLEGQERNRGNESYWLDGSQINLFNPETIAKILYYDGETKKYIMVNLGNTPKNTSDKYISLSYTKNNLTTNYEVRNISAYCLIEAISDSYDYSGPTIIFNIKVTMKNIDYVQFWEAYRDEYSSIPRCILNGGAIGAGVFQSGYCEVRLRAMGALPPTSCITVKYTDKMGRETYSQYNFIEIDYRASAGAKPDTTKYYVEGYVTHK